MLTGGLRRWGLVLLAGVVSGCNRSGPGSALEPVTPAAHFQGTVLGGQQPVSGASVQLYAVGANGDGSPATPLLSPAAVTDANGNFNISGAYACPAGNPLVYMVATGGNPGVGTSNPELSLMAALGACGSLGASTFIVVNELTTVGAVYPLAAFMASASAIGSGASDAAALASAFTLASELVNTATGTTPGANVPAGVTVPVAQIDTIADILASCINSAGGVAGDGSACGSLFALTTPATTAPADTITALLNLANNPTLNTAPLYNLASPTAPFQPMQTVTPPDLAVRLIAPSTLSVAPASLSFGSWATGLSTPAQTITVSSYSSTAVSLNAAISGAGASSFAILSTTCGATVAPQGACTYEVEFAPASVGAVNAFFVLSNSTGNSPIEIPLSGIGVASVGPVTLSPTSLSWSNTNVVDTSQDVVVANYGNTPLTIGTIAVSGYFAVSNNNCGASLAAQSECTVSVASTQYCVNVITPSLCAGTMTIYDDASAGPQMVSLSTEATAYFDGTTAMSFVSSAVGAPVTQSLYFSSPPDGGFDITFTLGGADPGDFSAVGCEVGFYGPPNCTASVTFTPTAGGVRTAKLFVDGTSSYLPLTGSSPAAPTPGPSFTASPSALSLAFTLPSPDPRGNTGAGSLSIANNGTATFSYSGSLSGPSASLFTANGSNCLSLAPQHSCSVPVSFSGASSAGIYPAYLLVKDTNSTLSQSVPIAATATYWSVIPNPSTLQFGDQALGTASAAKTFVLADANGYPLGHPLSVALASPSNFTLTQGATCPASSTQTCTLAVAFSPYETGNITEYVTITDQTSGETGNFQLNGAGGVPVVSLSNVPLTFPLRATGTTSTPMTATLTNTGAQPLLVSTVTLTGAVNGNFTETNNCATVAASGSC